MEYFLCKNCMSKNCMFTICEQAKARSFWQMDKRAGESPSGSGPSTGSDPEFPGKKYLPRHCLKTIRLPVGKQRPRKAAMNSMFSNMSWWQDQNSDLSLTSKLKLPALHRALSVKGTRGSFPPQDLPFHSHRLSFPLASAYPHIAFPGREIQHQPLGMCCNSLPPEAGEGTQWLFWVSSRPVILQLRLGPLSLWPWWHFLSYLALTYPTPLWKRKIKTHETQMGSCFSSSLLWMVFFWST